MKDFFPLALLAAILYIYMDSPGTPPADNDKTEIKAERPPLEAPLLPPVYLAHKQPGWLEDILNDFNALYNKGKDVLKACQVDEVRPKAAALIASENADRPLNLGQLCDVFDSATDWEYVNDPAGRDYFAHPFESHRVRRGDCDDYAIYLASLASAIGFEADIVVGTLRSGQNHAFPEVCLGKMDVETVCEYLRARYKLNRTQRLYFRNDDAHNLYISLERGLYPGASPFDGRTTMRLFLTDHFIEQI
ncbi:MAG: transglutaminase domain-containing protein [Lewinellaceae bacterium]|nr:transglutaminase domain-containing protein [Lewinellaceae bacterium]